MNIKNSFKNKIIFISIAVLVFIVLIFIEKFYIREKTLQPVKNLPEIVDDFSNSIENKKSPEELGAHVDDFSNNIQKDEKSNNVLEATNNFSGTIKSNN